MFNYEFDYDEWPTSHFNDEESLRPYNENIFMIKRHYRTVFPEDEFTPMDEENDGKGKNDRLYKVKYSLNLLPQIGLYFHIVTCPYTGKVTKEIKNNDINFLDICCGSDELHMFSSESI